MRIRKPRMQGKDWELDCESNEGGERSGHLKWHSNICGSREDRAVIERGSSLATGPGVEPHEAEEHDRTSRVGEDEEFQRSVLSARSSPDADEEEHGDQYYFPENVEQNQVKRCEHAYYSSLENKEERIVFRLLIANQVPRPGCG